MEKSTTIDPQVLAHQLGKLHTESLPIDRTIAIINKAFFIYTTSFEYVGEAHMTDGLSEEVREAYTTLIGICNFVRDEDFFTF